jgi:peptidylprolyl isomerase
MPAVGVAAGALIGVLLFIFVFSDSNNGGASDGAVGGEATATSTATPGDKSGPPPLTQEPVLTESGLGIIDIVEGTGASPQAGQTAVVHYTGWLADGTKFDSSVDRGPPFNFAFGTGRVIPGWDEGLATMKVGGKRRLVIPSDLGYGAKGSPPKIPPDAELTFDIELLEISKP